MCDKATRSSRVIIISANRNVESYQRLGYPVIQDAVKGLIQPKYSGPIAGILSAAQQVTQSNVHYLTVLPCDTPDIPNNTIARLHAEIIKTNAEVAVVFDGHRTQNLHCLIDMSVIPRLLEFYTSGGRALHRWFDTMRVAPVDFSANADCFKNLNRPEDF